MENAPIRPLQLVWGCVTSFPFYRRLVGRPTGATFKTLAVLVGAVTLVLGGREAYIFNRGYLARVHSILKGNLPPITIRDGRVEMEGDSFLLEEEYSYPASVLKRMVSLDKSAPAELREAALGWIDENFPDPVAVVFPRQVARKIEETSGMGSETADYLRRRSDLGRFIFQVDLSGAEPRFPPRSEGFILTESKVFFKPFIDTREQGEDEDESLGIIARPLTLDLKQHAGKRTIRLDDATLDKWRRLAAWVFSPFLVILFFVQYFIFRLLQALLGCAVAWLACSGRGRLTFSGNFSLAVHALIPVVILGVVERLLPLSVVFFGVVFLAVYFIYVWKAARAVGAER